MMKRFFTILAVGVISAACGFAFAQNINGTEQLPNRGFEEYDNLGTDDVEPQGWNSFMTANTGCAFCGAGKGKRLDRSDTEKRPGTTGSYSVRVYSNEVMTVSANGNLTTGRMNIGSTTATDLSNHNFTDRANTGFNRPLGSVPDSVVFWAKYLPSKDGIRASVNFIIHDNHDTKDPGYNQNEIVAKCQAFILKQDGGWQRISLPFEKTQNTDARYILISATTCETPGGGGSSDQLFLDDMMFIYNPTLTINDYPASIAMVSGQPTSLNVSYTLTGTMNPNNNKADNVIYVELSDANGSFANPTVIGSLTTFESGTIPCSVPAGFPLGTGYRIRLRSTNYPIISADNGVDIEIFSAFTVAAVANNHRGTVGGDIGNFKQYSNVSISALAKLGNKFTHWTEDGQTLTGVGNVYNFQLDRDRSFVAHFDTLSYQFTLSVTAGGTVSGDTSGIYVHNYPVSLHATPATGYSFSGYYNEGSSTAVSISADYVFPLTSNRSLQAKFELQKYLVNVRTNNALWGDVTGGGKIEYGTQISLVATPKNYCEFVAWVAGSDTLSKNATFSYKVESAVSITGVFREIRYPVVVNTNPSHGGTVTGGGVYSAFNANSTIILTATPAVAYNFSHFKNDSTSEEFSQNPYTVLSGGRITGAKSYTAYFNLKKYNVAGNAVPSAGGTVSGAGQYEHGSSVVLSAVPNAEYEFAGWVYSGDTLSKIPQISFIAYRDTALNAIFRLKKYTVTVTNNQPSYGVVSGDGLYEHFSTATLTAIPNVGYEFRSWVKDGQVLDTVSPYSFTVLGAASIEANFSYTRKNVTAYALPAGSGTISGTGRYENASQVTLVAQANTGYSFVRWEDVLGHEVGVTQTIYLSAVSDTTLVARFAPIPYKITISSNPNGTVSFNGVDYSSSAIDSVVEYGKQLPLFASIVTGGYKFTGWTKFGTAELLSVEDTFLYTVTKEENLYANFSNTAVSISASVLPYGKGAVEGNGNYEKGSYYPITVVPSYGYVLKEWQTTDGTSIGSENPLMVYAEKDTSFVAVLEKDTFNVVAAGASSGAGRYCYLDTATLVATAEAGYHLVGWYESEALFSTDTVIKIEVLSDRNFQARFDSNSLQLTILSSSPHNSVVSSSRETKFKRVETLVAVAGDGNHFVGWVHGSDTIRQDTIRWTVLSDDTLTALFDTNRYVASVVNSDPLKGSVSILNFSELTVEFYHNDTVKIISVPNYGYHSNMLDTTCYVVKDNINVVVSFTENPVMINASCDLSRGYTSVEGGSNQLYGNSITATATSHQGYKFVKWTLADTSVVFSIYPVVHFTATQDTEIIAHFEREGYDVSIGVNNDFAGMITLGSETSVQINTVVLYDSVITVTATPAYGYHFLHWKQGAIVVSEDMSYQTTILDTVSIIAVFEENLYQVNVLSQSEVYGSTSGNGVYPYGYAVQIKATPNNNYFFDRWLLPGGEFISFDSSYTFTVLRDTTIVAIFRTDTFDVSADVIGGHGSTSGQGRYMLGQEVTLTATPDYGYVFLEWQDDSAHAVNSNSTYIFTADRNVSLHAVFVPQVFNVTISTNAGSGVDVRGMGSYSYGDNAHLFAFSDSIYTFKNWELLEGDSVFVDEELLNNMLIYHVNRNISMRAVYQIKMYNVVATASPVEGGSIFGADAYGHGSNFDLEATAAEHYKFVHWVFNDSIISLDRSLHITSLKSDLEFIAVFELDRHTITLACNPSAGGVLNGGGEYNYGDTAILSITLHEGYSFNIWRDKDFNTIGDTTLLKYVVTTDNYITAVLTKGASANEDLTGAKVISVYPNPASSVLNVDGLEVRKLELIDMAGKVVAGSEKSPLLLGTVPAGVYLLRIEDVHGQIAVQKVVKM
ncbi:MAG: InlB B-repeat-containing protein [Bacteroidales bacterium]|jgi:hypothetical protein|nr:InlB B-repeat-containing protein [Bacteroidales bacterium]